MSELLRDQYTQYVQYARNIGSKQGSFNDDPDPYATQSDQTNTLSTHFK